MKRLRSLLKDRRVLGGLLGGYLVAAAWIGGPWFALFTGGLATMGVGGYYWLSRQSALPRLGLAVLLAGVGVSGVGLWVGNSPAVLPDSALPYEPVIAKPTAPILPPLTDLFGDPPEKLPGGMLPIAPTGGSSASPDEPVAPEPGSVSPTVQPTRSRPTSSVSAVQPAVPEASPSAPSRSTPPPVVVPPGATTAAPPATETPTASSTPPPASPAPSEELPTDTPPPTETSVPETSAPETSGPGAATSEAGDSAPEEP